MLPPHSIPMKNSRLMVSDNGLHKQKRTTINFVTGAAPKPNARASMLIYLLEH